MSDGTRGGSNDPTLPLVATDDLTSGTFIGSKAQVVKLGLGAHNAMEEVDASHPLPVSDAGGSLTVDGTVAISGTVPVSGTFFQATQPVSGFVAVSNPTTNPETGLAKDATLTARLPAALGAGGGVKVDGSGTALPVTDTRLPAALGGATAANSLPVVLSSDGPFSTAIGSLTEAAPATDTASSGLNGRLQRIAQRLTSVLGAVTPGQTATPARVASSATNVTLKSASATHLGFRLFNESTQVLYAKYGTTAGVTDYTVQIAAGGYLEENVYGGRVDGIWASANGAAQVTPLTA